MPRLRSTLLVSVALVASLLLAPSLAAARPAGREVSRSDALPLVAVRLLSPIRGLLSGIWAENGSILDPNGAEPNPPSASSAGTKRTSGDNGSGPDPNA